MYQFLLHVYCVYVVRAMVSQLKVALSSRRVLYCEMWHKDIQFVVTIVTKTTVEKKLSIENSRIDLRQGRQIIRIFSFDVSWCEIKINVYVYFFTAIIKIPLADCDTKILVHLYSLFCCCCVHLLFVFYGNFCLGNSVVFCEKWLYYLNIFLNKSVQLYS